MIQGDVAAIDGLVEVCLRLRGGGKRNPNAFDEVRKINKGDVVVEVPKCPGGRG